MVIIVEKLVIIVEGGIIVEERLAKQQGEKFPLHNTPSSMCKYCPLLISIKIFTFQKQNSALFNFTGK